ncbi:hypothetical protein FQA39_LY13802 [Lamprigera yunnana]|nr:hypothetical protein FQA39_LY13802 [Lamprigera yunnana]
MMHMMNLKASMETDERKKKLIARRVRRCRIKNKLLNAKYHESTSGDEDTDVFVSSVTIMAQQMSGGRTQRKKNDNAK